jgi:hypothetical protein
MLIARTCTHYSNRTRIKKLPLMGVFLYVFKSAFIFYSSFFPVNAFEALH